jgi:hypothetical protein
MIAERKTVDRKDLRKDCASMLVPAMLVEVEAER